jgi:hypothetical protein
MTTYYNINPKFYVSVDCIIFGFDEGELKLLLLKRNFEPAMGKWFSVGLKLTGCILQDNSKHTAFNLWFTRNKHRIVHKAELHLKR